MRSEKEIKDEMNKTKRKLIDNLAKDDGRRDMSPEFMAGVLHALDWTLEEEDEPEEVPDKEENDLPHGSRSTHEKESKEHPEVEDTTTSTQEPDLDAVDELLGKDKEEVKEVEEEDKVKDEKEDTEPTAQELTKEYVCQAFNEIDEMKQDTLTIKELMGEVKAHDQEGEIDVQDSSLKQYVHRAVSDLRSIGKIEKAHTKGLEVEYKIVEDYDLKKIRDQEMQITNGVIGEGK